MHDRALLRRVINQQVVKFGACDLPRDRTLVMHGFKKIERSRLLAGRVCKLHAVLANERTLFEFFEQAETTKGPIRISHQRLANMMTRKYCLLKQNHAAPFAREHAGNGTPCGSTTHYDDVEIIIIHA